MLTLYKTKNERVYEKLKSLLSISDFQLKKTENGKPYIENSDTFFSVTHTGDIALIAISNMPTGVDAEKIKPHSFKHILKRFTSKEYAEIDGNTIKFLKNWVVKEAFIKMYGGTLAHDLKRMEYANGQLNFDGRKADCNVFCSDAEGFVYAICTKSDIPKDIKIITI